jgi:aspartate carbamoyltransferase catalytic subunit
MKIKHFSNIEDFSSADYSEICRRGTIFQNGIEKGKTFSHLCSGKVLATMFFQESTRTSSLLQSAMIRLGGGYIGVSDTTGTYYGSKEESLEDFLHRIAIYSDIMAIRHKGLDLCEVAKDFRIPLVNALCGGDEHSLAGLGWIYFFSRHYQDLNNFKIGIYGMINLSRSAKTLIKALSFFGIEIYVDSVLKEFRTPDHIRNFVSEKKSKLIEANLDEFISKVDFLFIVGGLPESGEDSVLVNKYIQKVRTIRINELDMLKHGALLQYSEPRIMKGGRSSVDPEIDKDNRVINKIFLREFTFPTMALISYLLNADM